MSKYTTEVRFICEQAAGYNESQPYDKINAIIQKSIPKIFSFDFPIFDENYRNVLCTKILRHYYTREICEEVVGLWKLRLETRLNEIMPYYNQLYKSELITFNPMHDTDLTTENNASRTETRQETENNTEDKTGENARNRDYTDKATTTGESSVTNEDSGTTTNTNTSNDLYSDTPQGSLQNVENETYLTNARKISDSKNEARTNKATGSSTDTTTLNDTANEKTTDTYEENITRDKTGHSKFDSTDSYIQTLKGKSGGPSYSKMLEDFRKTFLNIDMSIISELNDLFMLIW